MVAPHLSAAQTRDDNRYRSPGPADDAHTPPILSFTPLRMAGAQGAMDRARRAPNGQTILVCAPAGTGKTVLAADWVRRQPAATVRWVGLADLSDTRLWSAVGAALDVPLYSRTGPIPDTPVDEAAAIVSALAATGAPTVLVLDDAHLIADPLALSGLEYFVEHAPPSLTTVVLGRYDPPVRWHALQMTARLTRIGARDLRFDAEHTAALLEQHDCRLADAELASFHELTRGWAGLARIGAIHLAAHTGDRATAIAALEHGPHAVADFLVGELLSGLAPEVLDFLLATAVPASFSVDLAERLAGPGAPRALESLLRSNFPLEAAARGGDLWYTYHPMLRAYLLAEIARADPDRVPALHDACARWFVTAGMLPEALRHVLADPDRAVLPEFVREHGPRMVFEGNGGELFRRLDCLGAADDAFVLLLRTADAIERGDIVQAVALGELVRERPRHESAFITPDLLGALTDSVLSDVDIATGRVVETPPRELPAPTGHPEIDCYIALQAATTHLFTPDPRRWGEPELRNALALAERAALNRLTLHALTRLAVAAGLNGSLTLMRERSLQAVAFADSHHLEGTSALAQARIMVALMAYLQADDDALLTVDIAPPGDGTVAPAPGWHARILALLFGADSAADRHTVADALRTDMHTVLHEAPLAATTAGLLVQVTWALLRVRWLEPAHRLHSQAVAVLGRTPETILAEAAIAEDKHSSATTVELVEPLLDQDDRLHPISSIQAWLLYASACHRLDRPVAVYDALHRAATLAYTDRLIRPFLDVPGTVGLLDQYTGRFGYLDDFVDTIRLRGRAVAGPRDPHLTAAEIAVLRQLPSGMTTHHIAADLGVSINTVKTHLRGIYHKLGVRTRADAITRARTLGTI
ncbi:LuxR family maltose regulon positive regulatory protein [Nocardia transvalensis]|uniref:LuxR family maltose regulon positive regulatory protein n=1 Tax=Nocardia transvalensis TaxID=37333 RepID=A0A7W9UKA4_9NOCA|nr:LuxR C-terminal-related transcriptional regulator [Nocardia transvalensis]MBB5916249.1 LuxR family maltose regulon positive regulatory protein [Nocardia transvalensis]